MAEKNSSRVKPSNNAVPKDMEKYVKICEKPISKAYPEIDTDLARDNLENDLTAADLQDL